MSLTLLLLACCALQADPISGEAKISCAGGGFAGAVDDSDWWGMAAVGIGDLDGNGVQDLAIGATGDDGSSPSMFAERGAVWILFMNSDGTVLSWQRINEVEGGFPGPIGGGFGTSLALGDDLDGDGIREILVGDLYLRNPFGRPHGGIWVVFLRPDGTVRAAQRVGAGWGGFTGLQNLDDYMGTGVASIGDLDGDGLDEIAVASPGDDDGGAIWILFPTPAGTVRSTSKISPLSGGFSGGILGASSVGALGDLDGDGNADIAVGNLLDDGGGPLNSGRGAVWVLFLNADGSVRSQRRICDGANGFNGPVANHAAFGAALTSIEDMNGNGRRELVVGAPNEDVERGVFWILELEQDATVSAEHLVAPGSSGFVGPLDPLDSFASGLGVVGSGSTGGQSLIVGAPFDGDCGTDRGAVWLLSLRDGIAPTLTCPSNLVVEGDSPLGATVVEYEVLVDDNTEPAPVPDCWPVSGASFPFGQTLVTCSATDGAGNSSSCGFEVLVRDTTPPRLTVPSNRIYYSTRGGLRVSFMVTASDACDASPVVSSTPPSGSYFPYGTTVVRCLARDRFGNSTQRSFLVTVRPQRR